MAVPRFAVDDDRMSDIEDSPGDSMELWYVYLPCLVDPTNPARDFELVKVGITKNDVERRIEQLQTGNPYQLRCEASFLTTAARQVEHWVHRTNASRVAQLEWLRVPRQEIQALVAAARCEAERLAHIVEARTHWSQQASNAQTRSASAEEHHLHEQMQDVLARLCPLKLRLRSTVASIALTAGKVLHVPGILRTRVLPASRRFNSQAALAKFPGLAAGETIESVGGKFRWRQVPNLGSAEWSQLRVDA